VLVLSGEVIAVRSIRYSEAEINANRWAKLDCRKCVVNCEEPR
jgi:hypothetical protein